MSALFALIPLKDWLYGGAIVLLIVFGLHYHHKVLAEGIAQQKAADDKASAKLNADTIKDIEELKAKAGMAEQAYEKESNAIANQPAVQPVRLCLDSHNSRPIVPNAAAPNPGNATAGAPAVGVQQVPAGNSSVGTGQPGPDLSGLLGLLSRKADNVSAELREYQGRQ